MMAAEGKTSTVGAVFDDLIGCSPAEILEGARPHWTNLSATRTRSLIPVPCSWQLAVTATKIINQLSFPSTTSVSIQTSILLHILPWADQRHHKPPYFGFSWSTKNDMANYLASIFGTEQDKVNCSFYYKIGACRHGDRCSRKHVKPSYSQTILLPNLYQNPAYDPKNKMNPSQIQNHFDAFYEDIWCEMCKYGEIEEIVVCDNNNDRKLSLSSFHSPTRY